MLSLPCTKLMRYQDCQQLDWKNHKILCKTFNNDARPSPAHRRALLFPGGSQAPRFEWVLLYPNRQGDTIAEDFVSIHYFGTNNKDSCGSDHNGIQGRQINREADEDLWWFKKDVESSIRAPDQPNLGLRAFTRAGACWQDLKGPVFVMRAVEDHQRNLTHRDMDMRDVRNAADYLSQTYRDGYDQEHLRDVRAFGTKIACDGAVKEGQPKLADLVLNGCDRIWNSEGSIIANLLGLPLLARSAHNPYNIDPRPGFNNLEAELLLRDLDSKHVLPHIGPRPSGIQMQLIRPGVRDPDLGAKKARKAAGVTGFGSSLQKVSIGSTGSLYVVRADGKPLPMEHTEALCSYINEKVEPQLVTAIEGLAANDVVTQRDDILNSITKASFLEYYDAFKETKIAQGQLSWRDLPNPYDIKHSDMRTRVQATIQAQQDAGFEQESDKLLRQEAAVHTGAFTFADLQEALGQNVPF